MLTALMGSAASLVMLASPAFAQEAAGAAVSPEPAAEASQGSEDIVVTATRRSETVRNVPFNIQAITGDALEKTGATKITDFARMVPGLSFTDGGARSGVLLVLRGLRTGDERGVGSTTAVYVDDIPMDMPYRGAPLDLSLVDVERVEVLRGPQGTLYGGGSIGGTVRYISKKPDFDAVEGRVSGELSSTRHGDLNYNTTATINLPVSSWIAVRANIGRFDNAGFIDNVTLGTNNVNDDRTTSGRVAVLMQPASNLDINLSYYRQTAHYGELDDQLESHPALTVDYAFPADARYTAQLANLSVNYDFGWAKLTSSTSYVDERLTSATDDTFEIRDMILASFIDPDDLPEFVTVTERRAKAYSLTQEVRLVSNSDSAFDWIIGGYYNKMRVRENQQESILLPFPGQADFEQNIIGAPLSDGKEFTYAIDNKTRQVAVFGELKYHFTEAWQASVGGRYFDVRGIGSFYAIDQLFDRDADGFARTIPVPGDYSNGRYREKGSIWRFNSSYKFGRDGLVYVTIAQGFRPGGFNLVTSQTGIPPEGRQYESDNLVSYEIGGKFSLLRNRIYLNSSIFRIDWSDIQTTFRTALGADYLSNAGKAVSQGLELELATRDILTPGLSFNLGYAYTDAKLTESIEDLGFKGERTPMVPRHTLSFTTDYSAEIANGVRAGLTWITSYTGGSYGDFGRFKPIREPGTGELVPDTQANRQYLPIDSYWLTNVSLRIEGDSWSARVFADNLFDVRYKTSRRFDNATSRFAGPDVRYTASRPRTIGIELTKSF